MSFIGPGAQQTCPAPVILRLNCQGVIHAGRWWAPGRWNMEEKVRIMPKQIVSQLKTIGSDIEEIKDSQQIVYDLHKQVDILTDTVGHLVRQNNFLQYTLQSSLKGLSKDLKDLKKSQAPVQSNEVSSSTGSPKHDSGRRKGLRPSLQKQWSHIVHLEEALQENIVYFVDDLSFSDTRLPDRLIDDDCLSEDECSTIRNKSDKDQVRHLLYKVMSRGPEKIMNFLNILKENDYHHLTDKVSESLTRLAEERKTRELICAVCKLKKNVDLKDVCDYLFKNKLIERGTYGTIIDPRTLSENREYIWSGIIYNINRARDVDQALGHLKTALHGKYDYMTNLLTNNASNGLHCTCDPRRRRRRKPLISEIASQTEFSTTSEVSKRMNSNETNSEADSAPETGSLDFADLSSFKRMTNGTPPHFRMKEPDTIDVCDGASDDGMQSKRSRHTTGEFEAEQGPDELMKEYLREESTQYVEKVDDTHPPSSTRPLFQHSTSQISTTTLRPSTTTWSSGDGHYLTDESNAAQSPTSNGHTMDSPVYTSLIHVLLKDNQPESFVQNPQCPEDKAVPHTSIPHGNARNKNLRKLSERLDDGDSSFADGEEDEISYRKRTSSSRSGKYPKKRNASFLITKSKKASAPQHQIDRQLHRKKKTKQRTERRMRQLQKLEDQDLENENISSCRPLKTSHNPHRRKVPYNPTWLTHVQPPRTSSWDYNQARRHWLMSHKCADSKRKKNLDIDQSWTEGSDAFV